MSHPDDLAGPWRRWRDARPPARNLHLDAGAAGRSSAATLRAVAAHAEREAAAGAYVAEAEAEPVVEACREALAGLLGLPGAGVAFTESASAARERLLSAWPLRPGDTVAVVPSEWGPALESFSHRGLRISQLAVHRDGAVDLAALGRLLDGAPPALVHLTVVASHRALVQPAARAAELCRAAGVPLWVDAAQALGHVDTAVGADVIYATSRKWLTGPRGVGIIGVAAPWWDRLALSRPAMAHGDDSPVRWMESHEAHVAGRVGLAVAVSEHLATGPERVRARLAEVGRTTREVLADLPGWAVACGPDGADEADGAGLADGVGVEAGADVTNGVGTADGSAITGLRPTRGQDVAAVRARLLAEHRILTSAAFPPRAPREMTGPVLRVSPHVDCTAGDLARLRAALAAL